MSVVNISKLEMGNIVIKPPVKRTKFYQSSMTYNKNKLYIQLSNVQISDINDKNFQLLLSTKQTAILNELECYIIQNCVDNSKHWFGSEMSFEQIGKNFISLMSNNTLTLENYSFRLFDKDNNEISKDNIHINNIVTVIVCCNTINFWSSKITYALNLTQMKKHINPNMDILFIESDDEVSDYTSGEDEEAYERTMNLG